jgi:hypothetical protein
MRLDRKSAVPSLWAILVLAACCLLSMVIAYRARAATAAAETPPAATAPAQGAPAAGQAEPDKGAKTDKADKTDKTDKGDADPTAPAKGARPPPSKAEESATIQDDPTLVPDDKESADNNVTFPIDI